MFTHLTSHSHYSLLEAIPQIPDLVNHAKSGGATALGLTDTGVMYGIIEFYNKCLSKEIKPLVGTCARLAKGRIDDHSDPHNPAPYTLNLLAKNYEGYLELLKLASIAGTTGFFHKPRLDKETLKGHGKNIFAFSGSYISGEIASHIKHHQPKNAEKALEEYLEIFGENFYLELNRNAYSEKQFEQTQIEAALLELAKKHGVGIIASQNSHYLEPKHGQAQDVLFCIGKGLNIHDTKIDRFQNYDLSLKPVEEMLELFKDLPEAISNTNQIAETCSVHIPTNQRYFAKVFTPPGKTTAEFLTEETFRLAPKLYAGPDGTIPEHVVERINYELDIINSKGFDPYFIMVADIVKGAHELGAITNTRGSAAGSIVGRILDITTVDPLYYELPFERFLTKHRPTPPDIDLDISDTRRDETIAWITNRYGKEKVAQIITFGTMKARAAVRDVGRALGVPYGKCDRIAKMIPIGKQGFDMTLDRAADMNPELKSVLETDPETKQIFDIAHTLEGCARHASIHAAAVCITPTDITDYTPIQAEPEGTRLLTQYDMYSLDVNADGDAIGVIKLDLLGIRNLSILEGAISLVKQRHNVDIDIYNLPHPDPKTFELLSKGFTFGVFQLGSAGMTRYLKELKPSTIFDIMAMIALYRPGPMPFIPEYIARKHDASRISYFDAELERILKRTYGVLVYQDDLLTIAHDLAGYTWEEVDKFRKAVGKKIPEEMAKQKSKFIDGCVKTSNWSNEKATKIWEWIEPFAAYGFNKSHSASYAIVGYQTAYMKANYPVEFMTAVMSAEAGDEDKIYAATEECKAMGLNVLPPSVNESGSDFTVISSTTIRFGLNGVKNLGSDVVEHIIAENKKPFTSLEDFLGRVGGKGFNKKSWEALVKCGALDDFGERATFLNNTDLILEYAKEIGKSKSTSQVALFGFDLNPTKIKLIPAASPATMEEKLVWEKEHLGLFVSAHPLDNYQAVLRGYPTIRSITSGNSEIKLAGIITKFKRIFTKKNEAMCFFNLQDKTGSIEVLVFPKTMAKIGDLLEIDKVLEVTGNLSDKDGEPKLLAETVTLLPSDEIYLLALGEKEKSHTLTITLKTTPKPEVLQILKQEIENHPGNSSVVLEIQNSSKIQTPLTARVSSILISNLKQIPEVLRVGTSESKDLPLN